METKRKVVVIGAGAVGSTFAYTLMQSGLAHDIVLVDADRARAEGEALDMNHGLFFAPPVEIRAGGYEECADASVVVVTAGARQKPGQTRLDLVSENVRICRQIVEAVGRHTEDAVILMVTNPVDVLTYFALKYSGLPRERVLGSGTVLDSARFRYLLSRHYKVDPRNVHAYIVGEHGDSEVALWSMAHIGGLPLKLYCAMCDSQIAPPDHDGILKEVRGSAYHVIESKGATYYAVSLALARIVGAILRDESSVLTVSTMLDELYGVRDISLSMPCVVDRSGVSRVLRADFTAQEVEGLRDSAKALRKVIDEVERQGEAPFRRRP